MFRFAHIPDCHLGCWSNHPDLKDYPLKALEKALDICINEKVDFILFVGDVFDTSLPAIDVIRFAAAQFRRIKEHGIRIYTIPGSHDFSPTGKTMLSVLEDAGLATNAAKGSDIDGKLKLEFIKDPVGAKLCGMIGRKGGLEKHYFESLDRSIEQENGFKIFMFHSGIEEFKPKHLKEMECLPKSLLPKNFDYYAAGHIHHRFESKSDKIIFPGVIFPASFSELEDYDSGFYIVSYDGNLSYEFKSLKMFEQLVARIKISKKTPKFAEQDIIDEISKLDVKGKAVLLNVEGVIDGKVSEIDFQRIQRLCMDKGAIIFKKNVNRLQMKEFEEIKIEHATKEDIEKRLIEEHASQGKLMSFSKEKMSEIAEQLMNALKDGKKEDETVYTYQERIKSAAKQVLLC